MLILVYHICTRKLHELDSKLFPFHILVKFTKQICCNLVIIVECPCLLNISILISNISSLSCYKLSMCRMVNSEGLLVDELWCTFCKYMTHNDMLRCCILIFSFELKKIKNKNLSFSFRGIRFGLLHLVFPFGEVNPAVNLVF